MPPSITQTSVMMTTCQRKKESLEGRFDHRHRYSLVSQTTEAIMMMTSLVMDRLAPPVPQMDSRASQTIAVVKKTTLLLSMTMLQLHPPETSTKNLTRRLSHNTGFKKRFSPRAVKLRLPLKKKTSSNGSSTTFRDTTETKRRSSINSFPPNPGNLSERLL